MQRITRMCGFTASVTLSLAVALAPAARSQIPAEEGVCDDLLGAAWGLCNAYCEVMDCDSGSAKASPQACLKVLGNFTKHSDEPIPCALVECPCFAPAAVDDLVEFCNDQSAPVECGSETGVEPNGDVITDSWFACFIPEPVNAAFLNASITTGTEDIFCAAENVPGTPDNDRVFPEISLEQAAACSSILRDRLTVPPCDTIVTQP